MSFFVYHGNDPVAAIGIVFKANMFIAFLQMGLANGVQPILGYNYGSGDIKRFRGVESYTKKCCVIVGILATLLYFILREPIIRLFIADEDVVRYGVEMLVAISAPTALAVEMAEQHNLTLFGFARHGRVTQYSGLPATN